MTWRVVRPVSWLEFWSHFFCELNTLLATQRLFISKTSLIRRKYACWFTLVLGPIFCVSPTDFAESRIDFHQDGSSRTDRVVTFSSPEPLGFTHHYEWLWLQPNIRIFSLANETQCALGIKLQSTAHFRRVRNCNVVVFKNQRVYKRTCFSFEHFERR